jgi:purine-binding chemotaxis protein CheW
MSEAALTSTQALTLMVDGETVALPSEDVVEVIRPRAITRVPNAPSGLLGLSNLRSAVLPIVSLSHLLGHQKKAAIAPSSRVVVLKGSPPFGLLVDEVGVLGELADQRRIDVGKLLAREFASMTRRATTVHSSGEASDLEADGDRDEIGLICFELSGQEYALPLDDVQEITALPTSIMTLPDTEVAILGVATLRHGLTPVVSPSVMLGLPAQSLDSKRSRIVVVRLGGKRVGLLCDSIREILRVPRRLLDPVPTVLTRGKGETRIEGICRLQGGRLISVLASRKLFDETTTERILSNVAEGDADMGGPTTQAELEQFIVFQLGDEHYGVPLAAVDEVVRRPDSLTRVPRAPEFIEGIMSLRGKMVPLVDQRRRFSVVGEGDGKARRVIVVTIDGLQTGFVVDKVSEILAISREELKPAPELGTDDTSVFDRVATIEQDGRMILLVDPRALLDLAERDMLYALSADATDVAKQ